MRVVARTAMTCLLAALAACGGDDGFSPTVQNVAGAYTATEFTATGDAGTLDLLALGAEVTVTLATDGTTTGRLFVPGILLGGNDIDEDVAGTWALSGSTVTFTPTAGTLIGTLEFTVSGNRLASEGLYQGYTLRIVLTRTG